MIVIWEYIKVTESLYVNICDMASDNRSTVLLK